MLDKFLRGVLYDQKPKQRPLPLKKFKQELLPTQISGKILDLQVQIQRNDFPKEMVYELIQSYSAAIQFYEEKNNQKYKLYQKRLKDFMHKPIIYSMMKGSIDIDKMKRSEIYKQEVLKAQFRVQEEVNNMMTHDKEKVQKQKIRINQSIEDQQKSFKKRMQNRKIKSQNNSAKEESLVNGENINIKKMQNIQGIKLGVAPRFNIRKSLI